ncbi:hypothetical protein SAMN05421804_101692 [Proteiniclasticum ruminis]|uniref:Uncharacterized protein n=1 Tax=Proteiniclasticum ruminis TaxID=398199 RepID=A0A1G8HUZ6_9CLOT|nr:hypothetical protein SAMN05421804_101692 [Proteiniclasticum ruminis]
MDLPRPVRRKIKTRVLYKRTSSLAVTRESVSSLYTFGYGQFRRIFRKIGGLMKERGLIEDVEELLESGHRVYISQGVAVLGVFTLIGAISALGRIIDAVTDPIIASLSDRIAMAIASCAHALGYKPYWFDLSSFHGTTGSEMIKKQNALYSFGSKLSQRSRLFNRLYWEPLNSEGFRKLSYNAVDQKNAELLVPLYANFPKDIPFAGTHVWPAQGAVHGGLKNVANVIPDNWPMGLHLSEGALHTVQTPFAFAGYKMLKGMTKKKTLGMPSGSLLYTGHYVDHELVSNLYEDTEKRRKRIEEGKPLRLLIPVGGAGAGKEMIKELLRYLAPRIEKKDVQVLLNFGDHLNMYEALCKELPELMKGAAVHFDTYEEVEKMALHMDQHLEGVHVFYHQDIFEAVYATNLLMRESDLLLTKPSELSFYPIPKLFLKRVGGHEAYGAIYAAQQGDGTAECETKEEMIGMMEALLSQKELLLAMNRRILQLHKQQVYHGGYEVVKLLTERES